MESESDWSNELRAAPSLPPEFFARPTLEVAPELIGKFLVTSRRGVSTGGRIVEVEAYLDARDLASHAARGKGPTPRNAAMYGPPGRAYVYRIYGIHHCFNIVTELEGTAGAVLIRAIVPRVGIDVMCRRRKTNDLRALSRGPGRLCAALGIDRRDDSSDLRSGRMRVLDFDLAGSPAVIRTSPRIGVDYAGAWARKPYRFFEADSTWVSGRAPGR